MYVYIVSMSYFASVVIATYNAERCLDKCLTSCITQTLKPEIIVIDGGSTDGTLDIIKRHSKHIDHFHTGRDAGVYDAWNKALQRATGDYLIFLGADDYFARRDSIEIVASHICKASASPDILYGVTLYINFEGEIESRFGVRWSKIEPRRFSKMTLPPPSTFIHRRIFQQYGGFDLSYKYASDLEFFMRVFSGGVVPQFIDKELTYMLKGGFSSKHEIAGYLEIPRMRRSIGRPSFSWVTSHMIFKAYFYRSRKQIYNFIVVNVIQKAAQFNLFGRFTRRVVDALPVKR